MIVQGNSEKMQQALGRMAIPLTVVWTPDPSKAVHGKLEGDLLLIYDLNEESAWETFTHELVEYKLKEVTQVYRTLVNQLIEGYEKLAYQQKERFIEVLPRILETVQAERLLPTADGHRKRA